MPIDVFDFRRDTRNLYISPAMRGRFLRHEPGEIGPFHSHDIADECFLILHGQCEFVIDGERAILSPGQVCFTRPGQKHEVRVVGDEPMVMFLVVSPHIEPTHTFWADDGARLPERYGMTTAAEYAAADHSETVAQLASLASVALTQLASDAARAAKTLAVHAETMAGGGSEAKAALDSTWADLRTMYEQLRLFGEAWNTLAERVGTT
jgi:mannose-6-phosphate isomerase-like protein (cupin superfamily)